MWHVICYVLSLVPQQLASFPDPKERTRLLSSSSLSLVKLSIIILAVLQVMEIWAGPGKNATVVS